MAAPAMHIIMANKFYRKHLVGKNYSEYIVGTSFPDIRYLAGLKREVTHLENHTIKDILEEKDAFMAGMRFHEMFDEARAKFWEADGIYKILSGTQYSSSALKLYEDLFFYDELKNWDEITTFFDTIYPFEKEIVKDESIILKWHNILKKYLAKKPSDGETEAYIESLTITHNAVLKEMKILDELEKSFKIKQRVLSLVTKVENYYE